MTATSKFIDNLDESSVIFSLGSDARRLLAVLAIKYSANGQCSKVFSRLHAFRRDRPTAQNSMYIDRGRFLRGSGKPWWPRPTTLGYRCMTTRLLGRWRTPPAKNDHAGHNKKKIFRYHDNYAESARCKNT